MITRHEFRLVGTCPQDNGPDHYEVMVETGVVSPVETIIAKAQLIATERIFQEALTERLARNLSARVTTIGHHSGVKTTCTAGLA
jgi:hypothetical protein